MREQYEHSYPPGEWTVEDVSRALEVAPERFPFPTIDDEADWDAIRSDDLTGPVAESTLDAASANRGAPPPSLPASLFLDMTRTGDRRRYQHQNARRYRRLGRFAIAECIEREGRYLDDVLDYASAICEQSTWLLPAHLREPQNVEGLPGVVPDDERIVALRSAGTAALLAEIDYLLGDRLHPALRERIRHEVDHRVFRPYEARDDLQWLTPPANNWNAVCNAGVSIAALHLCDDRSRTARILTKAAGSLRHYLNDFDEAGCTAEGIGYWNYGFGRYVSLAASLDARTGGELSLLSPPIVRKIARFPLKIELSPGHFPPFSDAEEETEPLPYVACWLGERLDEPALIARGRRALASTSVSNFSVLLRTLAWCRGTPSDVTVPAADRVTFLKGYDWWIARSDPTDPSGLVVAAKGGHNGEAHNHNDCGSFVVHVGGESLLTDLGAPTYERDFFSDERYEYLVARSLGHSVPYVNGFEQVSGEAYAATVIDRTVDDQRSVLDLELAGCYPDEAGLDSLRRRIELDTEVDRVTVEDRVRFTDVAPGHRYEAVLVSFDRMSRTGDGIEVTGDRSRVLVAPDPGDADIEVERLEDAINKGGNADPENDYRDVWRAFVRPAEAIETSLRLVLTPSSVR